MLSANEQVLSIKKVTFVNMWGYPKKRKRKKVRERHKEKRYKILRDICCVPFSSKGKKKILFIN